VGEEGTAPRERFEAIGKERQEDDFEQSLMTSEVRKREKKIMASQGNQERLNDTQFPKEQSGDFTPKKKRIWVPIKKKKKGGERSITPWVQEKKC